MDSSLDKDAAEVIAKYKKLLESQSGTDLFEDSLMSQEYESFRRDALEKRVTVYENACTFSESIIRINPGQQESAALQSSINTAHLAITPGGAASFATLVAFSFIFIGLLIGGITFYLGELYLFSTLLFVISGALLLKPLTKLPHYFANRWRLAASNQMVLCILYIVMYMRHTSNLERAIKFAGEHVGLPLSLDLNKVLWEVETGKYITIKDSLERYLRTWQGYNLEFIESFNLIEGSLYEPAEQKRLELLEKAIDVMLEGTYDKMLHYARTLQSPITILYMLGVILPILGLVVFPLLGSFLGGLVKWYHLAIIYNLVLPVFVFSLGTNILSKRPTGYGESDIIRQNPTYATSASFGQEKKSSLFISLFLGGILLLVGFSPLIIHIVEPDYEFELLGWKLMEYISTGQGPYGFYSLALSLFIPIGVAVGVGLYTWLRTRKLIGIKEKIDALETEFSGALFQLGNRIGDGVPAEIAFSKVSTNMRGTNTGDFFAIVDANIRRKGMSLNNAIFDEKQGATLYYPSKLIESSMKVLVESSRKGPGVVSKSLITISTYADRIRKVNERLKDLLAEILSSMVTQTKFLTPVIAGIVVGVGSMVVTIIKLLSEQFTDISTLNEGGVAGGLTAITSLLNIRDVIPGFYFQGVVGLYVVEIIIILTILSTGIERGVDDTTAHYRISKNLLTGTTIYVLITFIGIIVFNLLANAVGTIGSAP